MPQADLIVKFGPTKDSWIGFGPNDPVGPKGETVQQLRQSGWKDEDISNNIQQQGLAPMASPMQPGFTVPPGFAPVSPSQATAQDQDQPQRKFEVPPGFEEVKPPPGSVQGAFGGIGGMIRQGAQDLGIGALKNVPAALRWNPWLAMTPETMTDPLAPTGAGMRKSPRAEAWYNRAVGAMTNLLTPQNTMQQIGGIAPFAFGALTAGGPAVAGAATRAQQFARKSPLLAGAAIEAARRLPVIGPHMQNLPRWIDLAPLAMSLMGGRAAEGGAPSAPGEAPQPFLRFGQTPPPPEAVIQRFGLKPPAPEFMGPSRTIRPGAPEGPWPRPAPPAQPIGQRWQGYLQLPGAPPEWSGQYGRGPGEVAPEQIRPPRAPTARPIPARQGLRLAESAEARAAEVEGMWNRIGAKNPTRWEQLQDRVAKIKDPKFDVRQLLRKELQRPEYQVRRGGLQ